jgi:hypothetical protein
MIPASPHRDMNTAIMLPIPTTLAISQVTQFELTELTDVGLMLAAFEAEFCSCDIHI